MWLVMMVGMMLPSAAPMVLTHAAIVRRHVAGGLPYVPSSLFLSGYLVSWSAFSALAAVAQWALFRHGLLDGRSLSVGPLAGGVVLVTAGAFQLSPAKGRASHCRAPLGYFMTEWRDGRIGAVTSIALDHTPNRQTIDVPPYLTVKTKEPVTHDFKVTCGIPGHDRPGQEIRAEIFRYADPPFDWEFRGKCGFATDFRYAST
jgi:hypothetical protein